jgi:hypothetical protein
MPVTHRPYTHALPRAHARIALPAGLLHLPSPRAADSHGRRGCAGGADVLILPLQYEVAELPGLPKSREKHLTIVLQKYAGLKDRVWSTEQLLTFPYHKISTG